MKRDASMKTYYFYQKCDTRRLMAWTSKKLIKILETFFYFNIWITLLRIQTTCGLSQIGLRADPSFASRSETLKFVDGETITLPCKVLNVDNFIVAWKRGIAILSAGTVKVTPDPRVNLLVQNGEFSLQIENAGPQDAGDYICQIATLEPLEITHTVEILVPPRIHHISSGSHLQIKKGSAVKIECAASGNPTPNITWSRKNNVLPSGDEVLRSSILSITDMDRHKGGVYVCKAENGVGLPASSQVVLHVLYPPEIVLEAPVVYSGEGEEAMLVCLVHGDNLQVIWFKDTMQIDTTERHIMENRGTRHTLIIRKVHPQDFGNYSCVAENTLGKSRKTLQLTGRPGAVVFRSPTVSQFKDKYNISWTVDSYAPVEEYKLFFRRLPDTQTDLDNRIEQSFEHHHQYTGVYHTSLHRGYNAHWPRNEWRDVVLPAVPLSHLYTQSMNYVIRGLDPDQHYEARVQARNKHGWSNISDSFTFSTSSNGSEMRGLSVTFYSAATLPTYYSTLTLFSFFYYLLNFHNENFVSFFY
ncbi:opioid-binding protein/cell adhesion molecule-like [Culicoides brevitarsis]|uniref:opioid-binding protein/cell adhesion molecule-like n=1 Tax=Culicoides brevitarsis TaxID=469753 RepID=UPI00307B9FE8